ncbi:S41 family peptidase [Runella sp.]|uniref:S41 family peptidase n=1 Tax=Runella sp. TaxID=1960881 RepID=UPI003D0DADAC
MKFYCLLILLVLSINTPAQNKAAVGSASPKQYLPKALQEDFSIFRKTLETTYPSLYRYSDSITVNAYLDKQFDLLNRPMGEKEFYRIIALSCARINDEHLIPKLSPNYFTHHYFNKVKIFPFTFKIINRRFYILKSAFNPSPIKLGSELISINGRPMEEILNLLLPSIPSDGYIQTFDVKHLEDYSTTQEGNLFDLNYPLFVEEVTSFRLEYIPLDEPSIKRTVVVDGLTREEYRKFYNERRVLDTPLTFKYLKEEVAYLKISSFLGWHRRAFKQNFDSLYSTVFNELKLKKTPYLILDLRNNEGGDNTGEELIAYLLKKPYRHLDYIEKKYVGLPPVSNYLENGKELYLADSIFYKNATGNYRIRKEYYRHRMPLLLEQQPKENHFTGQLIVLANGASGSMAAVVCSFLKSHQRAVFVGEETGGAMEGPTSRSFTKLTLPNTHISIGVPLTKTVNAVTYTKGRGVIPDYRVEPAIEDILHGVDTELNFALKLINRE